MGLIGFIGDIGRIGFISVNRGLGEYGAYPICFCGFPRSFWLHHWATLKVFGKLPPPCNPSNIRAIAMS